ncbi:MAG: T9SS type A sorting domain-containing protein [Reichenbachiella sp.]|uniref:T9SS type A sorting domain-containing protein n=1 Tax=Reichenbachiella sp. TaxID=2184521 RepID=UPI003267AE18
MKKIVNNLVCYGLVWFGLSSGMLQAQSANFAYSSGRLFQDPETSVEINSPYLAFSRNGKQEWIAFDPGVQEGRFVSVASSFTGGVVCGYVNGQFTFLGKTVRPPSGKRTGVVVSVNSNQELLWLYTHEFSLLQSTFTSVVKRPDGHALVSGYEFDQEHQNAVLLCLDRKGVKIWERRVPMAGGYHLLLTEKGDLKWMTLQQDKRRFTSVIYSIDPQTGETLGISEENGGVNPVGVKGSLAICRADFQSTLTVRWSDLLAIAKYDQFDQLIWQSDFPIASSNPDAVELTGIVMRPNTNIQISLNLYAGVEISETGQSILPGGEGGALLVTFDSQGKYIGHEFYDGLLAKVNGIFKSDDKIGIIGCHKSNLWIQDSLLVSTGEIEQSYLVYLKDFEAASIRVSHGPDSLVIEHMGGLTLFPNPVVEGQLTILDESVSPETHCSIAIYDSAGKLHLSMSLTPESSTIQAQANVSALSSGLYHVFLSQNDQPLSSGRFIIQR